MWVGNLALVAAALFTGAAFYINFAEQPARLALDEGALLTQWRRAYERGFKMQGGLSMSAFLLGLLAWWSTGRLAFLAGAVLMIANWPYTMLAVLPINKALTAAEPAQAGAETRALIVEWNRRHAVRTALGALAVLAFLLALA